MLVAWPEQLEPLLHQALSIANTIEASQAEPVRYFLYRALHAHQHGTALPIKDDPASKGLRPWQIERLSEIARGCVAMTASTAALAKACGMSPRSFARAFKVTFDDSPGRWLRAVRLQVATEALRRQGDSLSEIALTHGFSDQSHFTRAFKAKTGITPRGVSPGAIGGLAFAAP